MPSTFSLRIKVKLKAQINSDMIVFSHVKSYFILIKKNTLKCIDLKIMYNMYYF